MHSGGIQYYGEHASDKPAALMKDDPNVRAESITVEWLDGKVIMEMKIEGNFYRAEKLPLYHDQDNLPLGEGIRVGEMGVTPEFDTLIPMEPCGSFCPTAMRRRSSRRRTASPSRPSSRAASWLC